MVDFFSCVNKNLQFFKCKHQDYIIFVSLFSFLQHWSVASVTSAHQCWELGYDWLCLWVHDSYSVIDWIRNVWKINLDIFDSHIPTVIIQCLQCISHLFFEKHVLIVRGKHLTKYFSLCSPNKEVVWAYVIHSNVIYTNCSSWFECLTDCWFVSNSNCVKNFEMKNVTMLTLICCTPNTCLG